jgi:hypothetical protein
MAGRERLCRCIETRVTELGTLEVWCVSATGRTAGNRLNIREKTEVRSSVASRYLIGIDLGTTNSVVAYIDTQNIDDVRSTIRVFPVPQLVGHGEVRTLPALPSFLYFPTEDELSAGAVSATWDEDPPMVTGVLAREHDACRAARLSSAVDGFPIPAWIAAPGSSPRRLSRRSR